MLQRIVRLKPALVQTLINLEDVGMEFNRNEWDTMEKVIRVLRPFEEATRWLSREDSSISMTIPIVTTIIKSLETEASNDTGILTMKRNMKTAMEIRFKDIETEEHYTIATLLDTKFKRHFYRKPCTFELAKASLINKLVEALENDADSEVIN